MNTGTHMLWYEILKAQLDFESDPVYFTRVSFCDDIDDKENYIIGDHLIGSRVQVIAEKLKQNKHLLVCPMRHPARVWASFLSRQKSIEEFNEQWDNMINIVSQYKPLYIHMEELNIRDKQVEKLAKLINKPLKTSWPVNYVTGSRYGNDNIEISNKLLKDINPKYISFYNNTVENEHVILL